MVLASHLAGAQMAMAQTAIVQPAVVQPAIVRPAVVQPAVLQPAVVQKPASATPWSPVLRCELGYAGAWQSLEARAVAEPYEVPSVEVGGRFWFKPVMVGSDGRIDYIKLYAYLDTGAKPLLIQVAKYLPPFPSTKAPVELTGTQYLHAGPVERELTYRCTLEGHTP